MSDDPFAGYDDPFTSYADLLSRIIRTTERQARRLKDPDDLPYLEDRAADRYEEGSEALAHETWANRALIENELAVLCGASYSALDEMIGFTHGVHTLLNNGFVEDTSPPEVVKYVVSLLLTRATSTAHEVSALLRAGFPVGAFARWRALYEIKVVSRVLEIGHRGTAGRYANHRWVQFQKFQKRQAYHTDSSDVPGALTTGEVDRTVNRLMRRYGPEYKLDYGWASEVTRRKLKVVKPEFWNLEELAGREAERHEWANRSAHADSSFANLLMATTADGLLNPGARTVGIKEAAMDTVWCLQEIVDALLGTWGRYPSCARINLMRGLNYWVSGTLAIRAGVNSNLPDLRVPRKSSQPQQ
jgi:hypothetical protein